MIALAHDRHYHAHTKHIDIHYHFIHYIIEAGTIKLVYCPINNMTADTLTKVLPFVKAKHFSAALGHQQNQEFPIVSHSHITQNYYESYL